tara:strand:+ start:9 stop:275 length:267 start_codon:yes stop_codon:yes gene_type:complete
METSVNEKQALMIAVAILGKEKEVSEYGYSALKEAKDVLQKMLDKKNKKKEPEFKPYERPVQTTQAFTEASLAEFEKRELEKMRGKKL